MKLPNGEQAVLDPGKLPGYVLNTTHPEMWHKARVFLSALGLTATESDVLAKAILSAVASEQVVETERDAFGVRYGLDFEMSHKGRKAMVRTGWIVRTGEDFLRFVTCYGMES